MGGTLEIDVLVAKTKYLDDWILILLRKGLQVVINSNEAQAEKTCLETEGKGN